MFTYNYLLYIITLSIKKEVLFMIRLEYYRTSAGLSQLEFAQKVGMTQQRISAYELGKRQPDLETVKLFADFFGITTDELLGIEKENTEVDEEFAALYRGYQTLNETDKSILKATLDAIVNAKKGDK
jgi:transcriptional regulator with XRE-family HTH domain